MLLLGLKHIEVRAVSAGVYNKGRGEVRAKRVKVCEDVLFPLREGQGE